MAPTTLIQTVTNRCCVRQRTGVFRASFEDNLACAVPGAITSAAAREAAERAGLGPFLASLPNGAMTVVGEGSGVDMSQGTRLR